MSPGWKPLTRFEHFKAIDPDTLPDWVDDPGVEKLAEAAFTNHNKALTLKGLAEVLNQNPAEIDPPNIVTPDCFNPFNPCNLFNSFNPPQSDGWLYPCLGFGVSIGFGVIFIINRR